MAKSDRTVEGCNLTDTIALQAHAEAVAALLPGLRRAVDDAAATSDFDSATRALTEAEDDLTETRRRLAKRGY